MIFQRKVKSLKHTTIPRRELIFLGETKPQMRSDRQLGCFEKRAHPLQAAVGLPRDGCLQRFNVHSQTSGAIWMCLNQGSEHLKSVGHR